MKTIVRFEFVDPKLIKENGNERIFKCITHRTWGFDELNIFYVQEIKNSNNTAKYTLGQLNGDNFISCGFSFQDKNLFDHEGEIICNIPIEYHKLILKDPIHLIAPCSVSDGTNSYSFAIEIDSPEDEEEVDYTIGKMNGKEFVDTSNFTFTSWENKERSPFNLGFFRMDVKD